MKLGNLISFIHIPRTGGHSLMRALSEATGERWALDDVEIRGNRLLRMNALGRGFHPPLEHCAAELNPIVISVVRNPWDWLLSLYHTNSAPKETFDQWLFGTGLRLPNQCQWLRDPHGSTPMPKRLLKYEHLQAGYDELAEELDLPAITLTPSHQSSPRKHYSTYYSPEFAEIVGRAFRKDCKFFDYDFQQEALPVH